MKHRHGKISDINISDTDVLKMIAAFLETTYARSLLCAANVADLPFGFAGIKQVRS